MDNHTDGLEYKYPVEQVSEELLKRRLSFSDKAFNPQISKGDIVKITKENPCIGYVGVVVAADTSVKDYSRGFVKIHWLISTKAGTVKSHIMSSGKPTTIEKDYSRIWCQSFLSNGEGTAATVDSLLRHKESSLAEGHNPFRISIFSVQSLLSDLVTTGRLSCTETGKNRAIDVGTILQRKDNGDSCDSWLGVVVGKDEHKQYFGILWLLDSKGSAVRTTTLDVGRYKVYQRSSLDTLTKSTEEFDFKELLKTSSQETEDQNVLEEVEEEKSSLEGEFVIWSKDGKEVPLKITDHEEALNIAKMLTLEKKVVYHVAKLVNRVTPEIQVNSKVETL